MSENTTPLPGNILGGDDREAELIRLATESREFEQDRKARARQDNGQQIAVAR